MERGPNVDFSPRAGINFRCPRSAVEGAFNLIEHDPDQVAEFDEFLAEVSRQENPYLLDIGCHFGIFTFGMLGRCGPGSRAVAVDPSPVACRMVRHISEGNDWKARVTVLQSAAGANPGELEMIDAGMASSGYFVLPSDHPQKDRIRVPIRTIDDLVGEFGVPHFIKIDVESFEGDVLRGGSKILGEHRCTLFIELHNKMASERGTDPRSPLKTLRSLGYNRISLQGREMSDAELLDADLIRIIARKD